MPTHDKEYADRILKKSKIHAYVLATKESNGKFGETSGIADFGRGLLTNPGMTTQMDMARPFGRKRNSTSYFDDGDKFLNSGKKPMGLAIANYFQCGNLSKLLQDTYAYNGKDKQVITPVVQKRDIVSVLKNKNPYRVTLPVPKQNQQMQVPVFAQNSSGDKRVRFPQNDMIGEYIKPVLADLVKGCRIKQYNIEASEIHVNRRRGETGLGQLLSGDAKNGSKIIDAYVPNNGKSRFNTIVRVVAESKLLQESLPIKNQDSDWIGNTKLKKALASVIGQGIREKAIERITDDGSIKDAVGGFMNAVAHSGKMDSSLPMLYFLSQLKSNYALQGIVADTRLLSGNNSQGTGNSRQKNSIDGLRQMFGMKGLVENKPHTYSMRAAERNALFPGRFKTTAANTFNPLLEYPQSM